MNEKRKATRDQVQRYIQALERHAQVVKTANLPCTINYAGIHATANTVELIRAEIAGAK